LVEQMKKTLKGGLRKKPRQIVFEKKRKKEEREYLEKLVLVLQDEIVLSWLFEIKRLGEKMMEKIVIWSEKNGKEWKGRLTKMKEKRLERELKKQMREERREKGK